MFQPASTSRREDVRTTIVDSRISVSTLQLRSATPLGVSDTARKVLNVQIYTHTNVPTSPTKASVYVVISANIDTSIARLECGNLLVTLLQKTSHEHLLQRPRESPLECRRSLLGPSILHRCSLNRSITYLSTPKPRYHDAQDSTLNLCRPPPPR
jgi:hypothetical protein